MMKSRFLVSLSREILKKINRVYFHCLNSGDDLVCHVSKCLRDVFPGFCGRFDEGVSELCRFSCHLRGSDLFFQNKICLIADEKNWDWVVNSGLDVLDPEVNACKGFGAAFIKYDENRTCTGIKAATLRLELLPLSCYVPYKKADVTIVSNRDFFFCNIYSD